MKTCLCSFSLEARWCSHNAHTHVDFGTKYRVFEKVSWINHGDDKKKISKITMCKWRSKLLTWQVFFSCWEDLKTFAGPPLFIKVASFAIFRLVKAPATLIKLKNVHFVVPQLVILTKKPSKYFHFWTRKSLKIFPGNETCHVSNFWFSLESF